MVSQEFIMKHRYTAIKQHLFSDLNNEAVILSIKSGKYYGLNAVGASIWKAIESPLTFAEIQARVMGEYEVAEGTCHREVSAFLQKMTNEGLIEVLDETIA
jgi:Coenzyme PQQ synthesis protein D (PqqD)